MNAQQMGELGRTLAQKVLEAIRAGEDPSDYIDEAAKECARATDLMPAGTAIKMMPITWQEFYKMIVAELEGPNG